MIQAGRLDRLVTLEAPAPSTDGDPTAPAWALVGTVYAERLEARGLERWAGSQAVAEGHQGYRVRYLPEANPTWRLLDGSDVWRVVAAHEGRGTRAETVLVCERADPNDRL